MHNITVGLTFAPEIEASIVYTNGRITSGARGHIVVSWADLERVLENISRFVYVCEVAGVPSNISSFPANTKETTETDGQLKVGLQIGQGVGRIEIRIVFDVGTKTATFLPRPAANVTWEEWLYSYYWLTRQLTQAKVGW